MSYCFEVELLFEVDLLLAEYGGTVPEYIGSLLC